jgi:hypothetical protein
MIGVGSTVARHLRTPLKPCSIQAGKCSAGCSNRPWAFFTDLTVMLSTIFIFS